MTMTAREAFTKSAQAMCRHCSAGMKYEAGAHYDANHDQWLACPSSPILALRDALPEQTTVIPMGELRGQEKPAITRNAALAAAPSADASAGDSVRNAEGTTFYANPQQVPQRGEAVNLARNWLDAQGPNSSFHITDKGVRQLAEAVMLMDAWILEVTKSSTPSAKEPRVSGIQLVKMMRDQRDALADAMRLIVQADDMEEHNEAIFKGQWKKGAKAWGGAFIDRTRKEGMKKARTALEGVPTSEQQLRNIAEGIGMTYEELMAAMSRPTESGAKA